jgi:hypothetical protein
VSQDISDAIADFWDTSSPVETIEVDELITRNAQLLIRQLLAQGSSVDAAGRHPLNYGKSVGRD